jgi:hypothetical protein
VFGWSHLVSDPSEFSYSMLSRFETARINFEGLWDRLLKSPVFSLTSYLRSVELRVVRAAHGAVWDHLESVVTKEALSEVFKANRDLFRVDFNFYMGERLLVIARQGQGTRSDLFIPETQVLLQKDREVFESLTEVEQELVQALLYLERSESKISIRQLKQLTTLSYREIGAGVDTLEAKGVIYRANKHYSSIETLLSYPTEGSESVQEESWDGEVLGAAAMFLCYLDALRVYGEYVYLDQSQIMREVFRGMYSENSGGKLELPLNYLQTQGLIKVDKKSRPYGYMLSQEVDPVKILANLDPSARGFFEYVVQQDPNIELPPLPWLEEGYVSPQEQIVEDLQEVESHPVFVYQQMDPALVPLVEETLTQGRVSFLIAEDGSRTVTFTYKPETP